ncbi:MAG: HAD-IB family phosphatase [Candidatus Pacebacteria bacterium]|nr:HAD-IB family phosphatase [Candidatus Paceibacterota bacterium]
MNKQINIIFDFDSTLVTIEGIDELAKLKNKEQEVIKLTNYAMSGKVNLEEAFIKRLEIIKPNKNDLNVISQLYRDNITNGAKEVIDNLHDKANLFIVSGGYKCSMLQTTDYLNIKKENVFANQLLFDKEDNYQCLNEEIPLWKNNGKEIIVKQIQKENPYKTIFIGDGYSDYETSKCVNQFICFAGVAKREDVMRKSKRVIYKLSELRKFLD